jgi:hypothetical protein
VSELRDGQSVYAVAFNWPDGSTSWAAMRDGLASIAEAFDDEATAVFTTVDDAWGFVGIYPRPVRQFASVESCTLRALPGDE